MVKNIRLGEVGNSVESARVMMPDVFGKMNSAKNRDRLHKSHSKTFLFP